MHTFAIPCRIARERRPVSCRHAIAFLSIARLGYALTAGIPEPDLVWYGQVQAVSGGAPVRVTTGTLEWTIEPLSGGAPWVLTTQLTNIHDQFSFLLRVPCESAEPNIGATAGTIVLLPAPATYRRVTVTLDGQPLALKTAAPQFSPGLADRGRSERLDLQLGAILDDSDGDGLADAWELQHFGNLNASPDADPDGDGMTNLQEYVAGTTPTDPNSLFGLVEIRPMANGIQLRWSSHANRTYSVLRAGSLLEPLDKYQVVTAGVVATPPVNEYLDATATGSADFFYVIHVEH